MGTPPAPRGALPAAPVPLGLVPLAAAGQEAPALFTALLECPAASSRWGFTKTPWRSWHRAGAAALPPPRRRRRNRKRRRKVQFPSLSFVPPSCRFPACRDLLAWTGAPLIAPEPCSHSALTPLQANPPFQPRAIFFQAGRCPLSCLCVPVTCSATAEALLSRFCWCF